MRLTAKKAVEITREAWMELTLTGVDTKEALEVWKKYGEMEEECPLCEYVTQHGDTCKICPLLYRWEGQENCCEAFTPWSDWCKATTQRTRKAAAQRLVALCDKWLEEHATPSPSRAG